MNERAINMRDGAAPSQKEVSEVTQLVHEILHAPMFKGKDSAVVMNALISAYWTAAHLAGEADRAAEGLLQLGGCYIAERALQQRAREQAQQPAPDKPLH